ncbi:nuclear transport factor 2 family protein [Inhella sp.]|uniref:nuclear transport factor 2 family protein n=1 Tax=Inhella sp. TaxID=1921806 RepID=UPI0035B1F5F7
MSSDLHRSRALQYLDAYARKDLDGVAALLAEDVVLRDWTIRVVGKAAALAETRKNFEAVQRLAIDVLQLHQSEQAVAAELRILIDGTQELFVTDVIAFDAAGRIAAIRAYVGRGDAS